MRYILVLFLFFSSSCFAEKVSLVFDDVKIVDFLRFYFSDVAKKPFVFQNGVNTFSGVVSLNLKDQESGKVESKVFEMARASGLSLVEKSGLVVVSIASEDIGEPVVYRPRHQSVGYLLDAAQSLFPGVRWASSRSGLASAPGLGQPASVGSGGGPNGASPGVPLSNQNGANSLLDRNPDMVVFRASEKRAAEVIRLLEILDKPSGDVLIKAVLYEVQTSKNDVSAVSLAGSLLSGKLGVKLSDGNNRGDSSLSFTFGGFEAILSALNSDTRFRSVSSPSLRVRSGTDARIAVGANVPTVGSTSFQNGTAIQSVQYQNSGVILELKPLVRADCVELFLRQSVSSFSATTNGVNSSPTLNSRDISTTVTVGESEVILFGGVDVDQKQDGKYGFAWLPWLSSNGNSATQDQILLVLSVTKL